MKVFFIEYKSVFFIFSQTKFLSLISGSTYFFEAI